jgi:hypothetical protein
MVRVAAVPV